MNQFECSKNMKNIYPDENNVVLNENSVEGKPCINRESKSNELTNQLYSCYDINMKFLLVVTPPSIYHGCSTRKTFWEEKFTGKKYLFLAVDMKNGCRRKIKKHKEIRGSDKIVTLYISSKLDSLDKMKITSSESKVKLERSGKELITSLGFKTKAGSNKYKKARYAIVNVGEKDLSRILEDFEKFEKIPYEKKRPKHEPTDSYFHLASQIEKCMMRSDNLNWYNHGGYTETIAPSLRVNVMEEDKPKQIIVHKSLSENSYTEM